MNQTTFWAVCDKEEGFVFADSDGKALVFVSREAARSARNEFHDRLGVRGRVEKVSIN